MRPIVLRLLLRSKGKATDGNDPLEDHLPNATKVHQTSKCPFPSVTFLVLKPTCCIDNLLSISLAKGASSPTTANGLKNVLTIVVRMKLSLTHLFRIEALAEQEPLE